MTRHLWSALQEGRFIGVEAKEEGNTGKYIFYEIFLDHQKE